MPYRRYPQSNRRYTYGNEEEKKETPDALFTAANSDISATIDDIPLPTDIEEPETITRKFDKPSLFDFIRDKIHIEEIILIGLILLLISEGIGDDVLIILLVYLLLA